jgi:UDP-N-acetylmuramate--alanine ligase
MTGITHCYFIGIGGIGMSAIARYLHAEGLAVAGYDRTDSSLVASLKSAGMSISAGAPEAEALAHFNRWLNAAPQEGTLVVRTPAVPNDFPVLVHARESGCRMGKRSEVLGWLTENKPTLAVAGTHGKTTTSALLAHLMNEQTSGCRAFIGGILVGTQSNAVWSPNAEWTVVEADEFDRSFLHLHPTHAAITSTDPDHLDVYGDIASFHEGFKAFAESVSGTLFLEADVHIKGVNSMRYGVTASSSAAEAWQAAATALHIEKGWLTGDVWAGGRWHEGVRFPLAGIHNVKNALAAVCLAEAAGADVEGCLKQLGTFQGIERRFAYHVRADHGIYIDDYAHHPVELEAAIAAARLHHPGRKITGIFQPHLFSRTRDNLVEFGRALAQLDRVFLLPVYPAREAPITGIDSQALFENIPHPHKYLIESHQIFDNLKEFPPDVLMTLGAGDIDRCVQPLTHWLKEDPHRFKADT